MATLAIACLREWIRAALMLTKAEIQRLRSLRDKKQREALGLFVVEGEKVIGELLAAGFAFAEIYATKEWRHDHAIVAKESKFLEVSQEEMAKASHYPTPSSVLGVGKISISALCDGDLDQGLTLVLDGVQDPGNVGTLLRVADWFAIDRVVLSPDSADLFHQKVINASMGSFARVRVYSGDIPAILRGVKAPVLGCDLTGEDVHALPAMRDAVILIGSEGRGLSPAAKARVTKFVTIPRYGAAESLNAGIAAAIVCDRLRSKR